MISVFGREKYKRRYYVYGGCHNGQKPRDEEMGLAAGEVTARLAKLLGLTGVETAYEEAVRVVKLFLIEISDNTVRKETERYGTIQAAEEKGWEKESQE